MNTWSIYLSDAELARTVGDPCFGQVEADSKEEAENKARSLNLIEKRGFYGGVGPWAVQSSGK